MAKIETKSDRVSRPAFLDTPKQMIVLKSKDRTNRFRKDRLVIGSVESADLKLSGEGVSPIHAVIEVFQAKSGEVLPEGVPASGGVVIYDLASDTGVFVNGVKTITQILSAKDQIQIGRYSFEFSMETAGETPKFTPLSFDGRPLATDPSVDLNSILMEASDPHSDLFDFSTTHQIALEVVMSWRSSILDVEHYVKDSVVTIGSDRRNNFGIPPILAQSRFSFIKKTREGWILQVEPKMRGVIQRAGRLLSLEQALSGNSGNILLKEKDFAKVSVGEVDFYMSYTPAPPRIKTRRIFEKDPFFMRVLGASVAASIAMVVSFSKLEIHPAIEAEQLPERIATILYQPEKYTSRIKIVEPKVVVPEVKPVEKLPEEKKITKVDVQPNAKPLDQTKPLPKEADYGKKAVTQLAQGKSAGQVGPKNQKESKEGAGAKAKGPSGTRGKLQSKNTGSPQDLAKRTSPTGGEGRGSGNSRVKQEGNLDLMKGIGGKIENLLGNSAEKLGKGGKNLEGFGGFTTRGQGGLALEGDQKGGGGSADSLGGLAKAGRGGGRVGTGMGAAGSGSGIVGGKTRVVIRSGGPEETVVMGAIDADAVERALLAHKDEFRLCYEKEINAENPGVSGRVGTSFVIGSSGRVSQAGIESSSLKNASIERCILAVIKRIDFPIPKGGGIVQVTYPFKFSSSPR